MAEAPRVSVILPTYNRARSLKPALDSVLSQDYADFELVVVDDASSDDTAAVLDAVRDPRLRVIRHPHNRGAAAARNTGLAAARGDLIAFQDSDDTWLPGRLRRQVELIDRLPREVGAVTGALLRPGRGRTPWRADWAWQAGADGRREVGFDGIAAQGWAHLQTLLVRKDCAQRAGALDDRLRGAEDWDWTLRLARVTRIVDCGEPVALLRWSTDSLTHRADLLAPAFRVILDKFERELAPPVAARLARMAATRFVLCGDTATARHLLQRARALYAGDRGAGLLMWLLRLAPWAARPALVGVRRLKQARLGLAPAGT